MVLAYGLVIAPTALASGGWSTPRHIDAVSCPSASFCVAVDSAGNALTYPATPAQIKAQLLKEITPRGKSARIAALLKAGAYKLSFRALSTGKAVVDWYHAPAGAQLSAGKPKPVLVASGSRTFSGSHHQARAQADQGGHQAARASQERPR